MMLYAMPGDLLCVLLCRALHPLASALPLLNLQPLQGYNQVLVEEGTPPQVQQNTWVSRLHGCKMPSITDSTCPLHI